MGTKTLQAVTLFKSGEQTKALRIFRTFRIGFTEEERRLIQITYESLTGKEEYYKSIQLDTANIKERAIQIIKHKYNI